MQSIFTISRAPRKQLATKAARKSAQIYGAEDYSDEENDSEVERSPSPVVPTEGAQRQELFTNLLTAVWTPAEDKKASHGTFAACKAIRPSEGFLLNSLHVEGAGELRIPLSTKDIPKLRGVCEQAPFGKGLATVVDTKVRRCWQVDGSKVTFPGAPDFLLNSIQPLATQAVRALGLDGAKLQVEAHLYKLLLYEKGGHCTFHRDTEKEKGMFGTLILQLPTEEGYEGGKLVVKHYSAVKVFDCQLVSSLGFCYTIFFADCLHELRKIESGARLCLVFNLVKPNPSTDPVHRQFIANKVGKTEVALDPWLKEVTEGRLNLFGGKLAIPLRHKYTEANLSFAGLKGDDSVVAEVLRSCEDKNKSRWLDLHLCLVTKHQFGNASPRSYWDTDSCEDPEHHTMCEVEEEDIKIKNWIGFDDVPSVAFKGLDIDMKKEAVVGSEGEEPFDDQPDDAGYEGHMGNAGPTLEHWYHQAMLVVWPKDRSFLIACEAGISSALDYLESTLDISDPKFQVHLQQILSYCENNPLAVMRAWQIRKDSDRDLMSPRLLNLCTRVRGLEGIVLVLKLLAKTFCYKPLHYSGYIDKEKENTFIIGLRNIEVVKEIAKVVQEFGWGMLSSHIIDFVKDLALRNGDHLVQLAHELTSTGNKDAGVIVAKATIEAFKSRIETLELHEKPVFSWCQSLAKLPEYPEVEDFLKGPQEKYVHRAMKSMDAARTLAGLCLSSCKDSAVTGYSATATLGYVQGGTRPGALCTIKKTRHAFERAVENWHKEREEVKSLQLELGKLKSSVSQNNIVDVNMSPSGSCQGDNKRQRLDTEIIERRRREDRRKGLEDRKSGDNAHSHVRKVIEILSSEED